MLLFLLLMMSVFASDEKETTTAVTDSEPNSLEHSAQNMILVKIEEDEYVKKRSHYFGVSYNQRDAVWCSYRRSKNEKKTVHNGWCYKDEETAALASDTLARKLIENGEKHHKLNFPEENVEVYPEKSSIYIGIGYHKRSSRWRAQRWSKKQNKQLYNGSYKDEETAAHASDNLARKLILNGEKHYKLNFPDDYTEVYPQVHKANYIGVFHLTGKSKPRWYVQRWSRSNNKNVCNGSYNDEKTAALASDALAKQLMENGEKGHKLNFPDDDPEVYRKDETKEINKRKRPLDSEMSQK